MRLNKSTVRTTLIPKAIRIATCIRLLFSVGSKFGDALRRVLYQVFYFLTNDIPEYKRIDDFLRFHSTRKVPIKLFVQRGIADDILEQFGLIQNLDISEDYTINVDMDEYWVMKRLKGIPGVYMSPLASLVWATQCDIYYAPWAFVVSDHLTDTLSPPYHATQNIYSKERQLPGKWMARSKLILKPVIHNPMIDGMNKQISIRLGTGKLLHFASRSFWDVAMKDTSPQLVYRDDLQADGLNQTLAIIASGTLPGRMRYMSYLSVLEKEITINLEHEIMIVDHKLELETASRSLNLPSNATLW
eukprot:CAMPEP_0185747254 /NCGR_PEP_ID=MMETSP1174-20130828/5858_1 /TAXON_ID=35687 /ORGANISM="Dictyocha speculum, Strain CCMP1381" /LENGTH=301 /DNA_ID=CAMNT_0028422333 /DNA_START=161 /DNA_END=1064 /DNA_ORIENTATION=-